MFQENKNMVSNIGPSRDVYVLIDREHGQKIDNIGETTTCYKLHLGKTKWLNN